MSDELVYPAKDLQRAHPIATTWRPALRAIVNALARGDFAVSAPVPGASVRVDGTTASQIKRYLAAFGEGLDVLPDETWSTSVAQWMDGYWDVLVDLWTVESGRTDLVLSARVHEEEGDFVRVAVEGVYVP